MTDRDFLLAIRQALLMALDALERKAAAQGFDLQETASGLAVTTGEDDSDEGNNADSAARRDTQRALQTELQDILREQRHRERDARDERQKLDREVVDEATRE